MDSTSKIAYEVVFNLYIPSELLLKYEMNDFKYTDIFFDFRNDILDYLKTKIFYNELYGYYDNIYDIDSYAGELSVFFERNGREAALKHIDLNTVYNNGDIPQRTFK